MKKKSRRYKLIREAEINKRGVTMQKKKRLDRINEESYFNFNKIARSEFEIKQGYINQVKNLIEIRIEKLIGEIENNKKDFLKEDSNLKKIKEDEKASLNCDKHEVKNEIITYVKKESLKMEKILIMYQPIHREIRFFEGDEEIDYENCPKLNEYAGAGKDFILQNNGMKFLDYIIESFSCIDSREVIFKGAKVDYEYLIGMIEGYNDSKGKEIIKISKLIELEGIDKLQDRVNYFYESSIESLGNLLEGRVKEKFLEKKEELKSKMSELKSDDVNLCFVGAYSAGKSTFINALIGRKILPEAIKAETAKMFKIKSSDEVYINFNLVGIDKFKEDITINWSKQNEQLFIISKVKNSKVINNLKEVIKLNHGLRDDEQIHGVLNALNIVSSGFNDDDEYIDGIIEIGYKISISNGINFTLFDTPGTDSDSSEEHTKVLKDALNKQSNSILIVLHKPDAIEGNANKVLRGLFDETEETSIDLTRSIYVINKADSQDEDDLNDIRGMGIFRDKRLFFLSARAGYNIKVSQNGVANEKEKKYISKKLDSINEESYFNFNKIASSEFETKQMINDCNKNLEQSKSDELKQGYINCGMYSIERDVINYAKNYSKVVKTRALYNGVRGIIETVKNDYELLNKQISTKSDDLDKKINILNNEIIDCIQKSFESISKNYSKEAVKDTFDQSDELEKFLDEKRKNVMLILENMGNSYFVRNNLQRDNRIITNNINKVFNDLLEYYFGKANRIIIDIIYEFKRLIKKNIKSNSFLDSDLIESILNTKEMELPKINIKMLEMGSYTKKGIIWDSINTVGYKKHMLEEYGFLIGKQYNEYIGNLADLIEDKLDELKIEFKDNSTSLSTTLEEMKNDREKFKLQLDSASKILEDIDERYNDLQSFIWREINE